MANGINGKQISPLAFGPAALASLLDEMVLSSGGFGSTPGSAQASWLVMQGQTAGLAPAESVELQYGPANDQWLTLTDGNAYAVKFDAIAVDTSGVDMATFSSILVGPLKQEGGVITSPVSTPAPSARATSGATSWTLTLTIGASGTPSGAPTRLSLTFTDTGTTAVVRCVARVELITVTQPPS